MYGALRLKIIGRYVKRQRSIQNTTFVIYLVLIVIPCMILKK